MSYTEEQLRDLLHRAGRLPYGPGQIALVEQVITQADALRRPNLAFLARMYGTEAYIFGGEKVRAFPTFAWCVAEFDRDPQAYAEHEYWLLWQFKYVISAMTSFPEIPLSRISAVLDDMQRRWTETGHSLHAVYAYRHEVAVHIGDLEAAQEYYLRWCAAPRDDLSDCAACDSTGKADWLATRDQDEEAIALGETVLNGQVDCDAQPRGILTTLMFPYLRTGRLEQARDAHRRAYLMHRSRRASLNSIADHIEFCARTGNEARAVEIVERHLGWLDQAPSPWAAMVFAASAAHALRRAQEHHDGVLTLHRPGDRPAGPVAALDLAAELEHQATDLAARFDERNGTSRVGDLVQRWLVAEPIVEYLQLSPTAVRPSTVVAGGAVTPPPTAPSPPASAAAPPEAAPETPAARFLVAADAYAESDQPVHELHNRWRQADALRRVSRVEDALAALAAADQVATRVTGDDPAARWELAALDCAAARILRLAKRLPEAEQRARRAIQASTELNPEFTADAYHVLSAILLDLGRPAEAEAAIQQALAVLPDGADRQPYLEVIEIARQAQGRSNQAEEAA